MSPPTYNQVTKHNLALLQPKIFDLLKQAAFIAIDAEFTGFGTDLRATRAKNIQERYQTLCEVAKSHALIAFGLSIFIDNTSSQSGSTSTKDTDGAAKRDNSHDLERNFSVHNFNFSMLSEKDYTVSPNSMVFLAENGLDLNQWVLEGIPYTGGDRLVNEGGKGNPNGIMRSIFKRVLAQQVPVVVHNGFLDLIYLYHSFYASLPPKLPMFVADLSDMFPGGIYDTKYVSDYITRERSSFLGFLFRKYERHNVRAKDGIEPAANQVYSTFDVQPRIVLPEPHDNHGTTVPEPEPGKPSVPYCEDYAFHGICKVNMRCGKSHDLDLILDMEEERNSRKRKKRKTNHDSAGSKDAKAEHPSDNSAIKTGDTNLGKDTVPMANEPSPSVMPAAIPVQAMETAARSSEKFHSAYFDAFMTGTVFSHQLNKHLPENIETLAKNRIYLIGKDIPLIVEKSAFAKYSPEHERLRAL
ncbi:ribonuclease CAF1 [Mortierella sp. GBAus27b]|nr:ribonuclease CAF1 [Mortierella sp. GBAus27b]